MKTRNELESVMGIILSKLALRGVNAFVAPETKLTFNYYVNWRQPILLQSFRFWSYGYNQTHHKTQRQWKTEKVYKSIVNVYNTNLKCCS